MAKLSWNATGERFFEAGVDRGVLYPNGDAGVAWNGLINVSSRSTGGEATPYYIDGVRYYTDVSPTEFEASIEAFTYPDEFSSMDGVGSNGHGLYYDNQTRKSFGLSYRTLLGNDVEGLRRAYKIHLVYNAIALPSEASYQSLGDSPDASTFKWDVVTTPVILDGYRPTSHLMIDTRKAEADRVSKLEKILYGDKGTEPRLPDILELVEIFDDWLPLEVDADKLFGLSRLLYHGYPDLEGDTRKGLYESTGTSRLYETSIDGLYRLEE